MLRKIQAENHNLVVSRCGPTWDNQVSPQVEPTQMWYFVKRRHKASSIHIKIEPEGYKIRLAPHGAFAGPLIEKISPIRSVVKSESGRWPKLKV